VISDDSPVWHCKDCGHQWGRYAESDEVGEDICVINRTSRITLLGRLGNLLEEAVSSISAAVDIS
jgi:hypothetical protein